MPRNAKAMPHRAACRVDAIWQDVTPLSDSIGLGTLLRKRDTLPESDVETRKSNAEMSDKHSPSNEINAKAQRREDARKQGSKGVSRRAAIPFDPAMSCWASLLLSFFASSRLCVASSDFKKPGAFHQLV